MTSQESLDINKNLDLNERKPKLVLHFDIRNTLIVADSVTSITVEQALNAYLTGVLWGCESVEDEWQWKSKSPSLTAPEPGTTTYYKHLERMIVKTPVDRTTLRMKVGDFVHTDMGASFESYYHKNLQKLEWRHKLADPVLTMPGSNGKHYHYILPAVYKLIEHLNESERDFNIIIRTYGLDCENVLSSLNYSLNENKHPLFPELPKLPLHKPSGRIVRKEDGTVKLQQMTVDGGVSKELKSADDIYKFTSEFQGVCGFRDDFEYWQRNEYHHSCAKPLWIDPYDSDYQHIIFDDNYRPDHHDSIVDVYEKGRNGEWTRLDNSQIHKYDNTCLVQVDLLAAINNDNYYIEKVKGCEAKYNKLRK
ncbi:uncharacterized protein [Watersipora subatra]|uniref:uncharacterized protein n=1 Tax=Watersipora subatra TaxID=2589382 RepID=UPI00355B03CA